MAVTKRHQHPATSREAKAAPPAPPKQPRDEHMIGKHSAYRFYERRDPASIYHEAHTKLTIPVGKALIDQLTYLESEFAKMDRMRDDALQRGIRTLKVTYEDLVKDKGAGLERVAKFVSAGTGCDAAGFTYTGEEASWHVVHPHPMSSYVKDWKDVVSTLRGTRFERFLAMDGSSAG